MTACDNTSAWPLLPIGELLERVSRPVELDDSAEYREIGIRSHCKGIFHKPTTTAEKIGSKRVFWIEPGCFIFNIIFAWEQAIALTSENEKGMIASHRFPMYRSNNGKFLSEFALLYFSTPRGKYELGIASPGGAGRNKTLGQSEFNRLKIPVPPIEHQQHTIEVIDSADRTIAQTAKLIEEKQRLKRGLMQQLLTGKRRFPEFGDEPAFQSFKLADVAEVIVSNVDKKTVDGERPVLLCNYTDVYYNNAITSRISFMAAKAKLTEIEKFSILMGDVIVTKDSETPDDIAVPALVTEDLPGVLCGYHLAIIRCDQNRLWPAFLSHLLKDHRVRHYFFTLANGATRFGLSKGSLCNAHLPMPSLQEQKKIASALDAIDRDIALLTSSEKPFKNRKKA